MNSETLSQEPYQKLTSLSLSRLLSVNVPLSFVHTQEKPIPKAKTIVLPGNGYETYFSKQNR